MSPQPAKDMFREEGAENVKSVSVFNMQGQKIKILPQRNGQMIYRLTDIEKGIYLVRLEYEESSYVKRLCVHQ